jgi:hypothetical protein
VKNELETQIEQEREIHAEAMKSMDNFYQAKSSPRKH